MCTWRAVVKQMLDGDLISRVQQRIRGSLVLWLGRTDHIAGGLWERARSLMVYEVDAHYSEIACGWRTRGPILLCIYFGSQANSIHKPSYHDDDEQFNFFLATWNIFLLRLSFHVNYRMVFTPGHYTYVGKKNLIAFLTPINNSSIHPLLLSSCLNSRLSEEYLHLWNASRWRSMKTMYASSATWSTAIRVRMGKRLGAGWRGSLHTDCQCLGESWFPQARGQPELLQEWGWSS